MSWLKDRYELGALSFAVPTACFAYLFLLSLKGGRKPAATLPGQSAPDPA